MNSTSFTGAITALVTPFQDGKVAWDELKRLVHWQIERGINGLVAVGTTGESPTLDMDEHLDAIRCIVEAAGGRVPVLAGTGANSTTEGLKLTRGAHEAGADGMLIVAPYYNKPSQNGLFHYFSALADETDRKIMLYSIPSRCGIEIGVPTIERLRAKYPQIDHIKEAGGSCDRVDQIRDALGESMTIVGGDDSLALPFMSIGAKGIVSVASNLIPGEMSELARNALGGNFAQAQQSHARLYPLFKTLFIESSPVPVKYALHRAGVIGSPAVRSPLCELEEESRQKLDAVLDKLNLTSSATTNVS